MNNQQAITQGAHHIGLTVPNIDESKNFFISTLGYQQVGEVPDYPAVFLTDNSTMITLWQVKGPHQSAPFDRHRSIGLHHLALSVKDSAQLSELHRKLVDLEDVTVEFAPETLGDGPAQHMMCYIPGGIRVEFIAAS